VVSQIMCRVLFHGASACVSPRLPSGRTAPLLCCSGPSPQTCHPWHGCGSPARPVPVPGLHDAKLRSPTTMVAAGDTQAPAPGVHRVPHVNENRSRGKDPKQRQSHIISADGADLLRFFSLSSLGWFLHGRIFLSPPWERFPLFLCLPPLSRKSLKTS
jgi:hypothetical protein